MKHVVRGFSHTRGKLVEREPKLLSARQVLDRTTVRSPTNGNVVGLNAFTVDGVAKAGSRVLDVVPSKREILMDGTISPENIDEVSTSMNPEAYVTGVAQKRTPVATGRLFAVSADQTGVKPASKERYVAQVRLDPNEFAAHHATMRAGMCALAVVSTRPRPMLNDTIAPLGDRVERVFREE